MVNKYGIFSDDDDDAVFIGTLEDCKKWLKIRDSIGSSECSPVTIKLIRTRKKQTPEDKIMLVLDVLENIFEDENIPKEKKAKYLEILKELISDCEDYYL